MPADEQSDPLGTLSPVHGDETSGTLIGHYRLLQKIGEGGMGEVWLAEQKEPVRRRVALKLAKASMSTREVMARFESERQALALMDHPAIAKVFDAASTPQGAPYFVMEYVAGVPITTYCDNHRLSTRERLELFMRVCEGVQHAHQKAIIHRDLKPSNILVTEVDGHPAPKIIDFGVAKALGRKLTADTMFTRVGFLVGTPEYMSPEQALHSSEDIDTRSDVYSLGIVFYELLAGAPPMELRKLAIEEFLRRLREEDPPKPSTKLRTGDPATSADVARKRQTEPPTLARQIRGDLDAIALKALEKDRARRYGSPSDFAADIGRYLRNEAVLAVPPSIGYRARKFARRYRVALATACAFALVLIAAAVVSVWQSIRANREAAVAQSVTDFLQEDVLAQAGALSQSRAGAKPDPDLKVRTALDSAAARIGGKFDRQPELEAAIRGTIGQAYMELGLDREAQSQFERALTLDQQTLGAQNPRTLQTACRIGRSLMHQGKHGDAEPFLTKNTEIARRVLGLKHPITLECMSYLASLYDEQGKLQQSEALHSQVIEIRRQILGPEHRDTLRSMYLLSLAYEDDQKYDQAEPLLKQTLEIQRRVLGPEAPETLWSADALAWHYYTRRQYAQAEALYTQNLEIERRTLGPEHTTTLGTMAALAEVYDAEKDGPRCEKLASQTLEIDRRLLGEKSYETLRVAAILSYCYIGERRYPEAERLLKQILATSRREFGEDAPRTLGYFQNLAAVYNDEAKYAEAEALLNEALQIERRNLKKGSPDPAWLLYWLSTTYNLDGKYPEAEALYPKYLESRPDDPDILNVWAWYLVADPVRSRRRPEEALPLARRAVQVSPNEANYYNTLGLVELRDGLVDEAIATLNKSAEMSKGARPTDFLFLAMAHWRHGDKAEAEQFYQRALKAASKGVGNEREWKMFRVETAELMGKPAPHAASRSSR